VNEKNWFEDIEFWEHFAPIMFDEVHWAEVPEVAEAVINLCRFNSFLDSIPKILDLCCGPGRISFELAKMGLTVTGVDITESFLKTAKEDAAAKNLNIEYIKEDARKFIRPGYFDAILNLYISFGYFEDQKDDLKVLRNVYESLKPGGTFIIETLGKEVAVINFVESEWFERAGYTVLTEYELLDSCTFLKNRWIIIKDKIQVEKIFTQRLYSGSELRALLKEAGFEQIDIYGDWDGSVYDQKARMLIAVCRK